MMQTTPIGHLVVVAGLKAAGKSTFIEQFVGMTLPPEIDCLLPGEARGWRLVAAGNAEIWLPAVSRGVGGLLLHYDLFRLALHGPGDAAASALLMARRLTVVNIRPPVERLIAQLKARAFDEMGRELLGEGRRDGLVAAQKTGAQRNRIAAQYATPGWPEKIYADWDAIVARAAPLEGSVVEVEPKGPRTALGWALRARS